MKKQIPLGVKLVSIFSFLVVAALLFYSYLFLRVADFNNLFALFSFLIAVLVFFVSFGLLKGQIWSRIVFVILSGVGVVLIILSGDFSHRWLPNLLGLAVFICASVYLFFNEKSKKYFK